MVAWAATVAREQRASAEARVASVVKVEMEVVAALKAETEGVEEGWAAQSSGHRSLRRCRAGCARRARVLQLALLDGPG